MVILFLSHVHVQSKLQNGHIRDNSCHQHHRHMVPMPASLHHNQSVTIISALPRPGPHEPYVGNMTNFWPLQELGVESCRVHGSGSRVCLNLHGHGKIQVGGGRNPVGC